MMAEIWQQYRKTAPIMQVFIVLVAVFLFLVAGLPLLNVLVVFVGMELFLFPGAAWSLRMKRKVQNRQGRLPLEGKH